MTGFNDRFMREIHKSGLNNILIENTRNFENYPTIIFLPTVVPYFIKYYQAKIFLLMK